jgi:polyisoprenoid-binding protein YceI
VARLPRDAARAKLDHGTIAATKGSSPMADLSALTPGTWEVDPHHSTVGFVVRHIMITKVHGRFTSFTGSITVGEDPLQSRVEATVDMNSIDTGDADRDNHLRTQDFFEVDKYPTMTFVSTNIRPNGDAYVLTGDLTLKGITKAVDFDLEFEGVAKDMFGNTKAAFSATAEINRKDYGVEWQMVLDTGGLAVSEKVKIELDIQAVKV